MNDQQAHYKNAVIEPIEIMRQMFTKEEYRGFLKGNILKYRMRLGNKQGVDINEDFEKIRQYEKWLKELERENEHDTV